jgi:hypothetical protein
MARPKAQYPRGCTVCRSTLPRHEWRPHKAHGRCEMHYRQWLRTLDVCKADDCGGHLIEPKGSRQGYCRRHDHLLLKVPMRSADAVERTLHKFASQVHGHPDWGCWLWSGRSTKTPVAPSVDHGYGLLSVGNHDWLAHRFSYGFFIGGHAPKLTLDHVCGVALCVRPDHLMPLTQRRNSELEHHRKDRDWDLVVRDLLLIPDMPPSAIEWAQANRLPVGRAQPGGETFGFGLDGTPFEYGSGPDSYPPVKALFRS